MEFVIVNRFFVWTFELFGGCEAAAGGAVVDGGEIFVAFLELACSNNYESGGGKGLGYVRD